MAWKTKGRGFQFLREYVRYTAFLRSGVAFQATNLICSRPRCMRLTAFKAGFASLYDSTNLWRGSPGQGNRMELNQRSAALTWLNAYRGKSLDVVDLYDAHAFLEEASDAICGQSAIENYWKERFLSRPAFSLVDLQIRASQIIAISYLTNEGLCRDVLQFDEDGKIIRHVCSPPNK